MKATKGRTTAAMLMLRCALVIESEGYVPEERPVTPNGHDQKRGSCRFLTNGRRASIEGTAAGGRRRAASRAAHAGGRDRRRAEPRGARLRAPSGGAVRTGAPGRGGGGARPLHALRGRPEGRFGRRPRGLPQSGTRRDAGGAEPGRA